LFYQGASAILFPRSAINPADIFNADAYLSYAIILADTRCSCLVCYNIILARTHCIWLGGYDIILACTRCSLLTSAWLLVMELSASTRASYSGSAGRNASSSKRAVTCSKHDTAHVRRSIACRIRAWQAHPWRALFFISKC